MFDFFSPIDQIRRISSRKAEKNISESYDYLMNDFRAVASILESYYPLEVIKLSLWDERKVLSEKKKDPLLRARAVLLPVILQSVLQSTLFRRGGREGSISQKDWSRLISLGDDTLRRIIRIIDNRTSLFLSSSEADDADGEKYRCIIAHYLIPEAVTPDSLKASSDTLRSLLGEKEGVDEKIGTDPLSLSLNIENIAKRGLGGIDDLCRRVQAYSDEYSLAAAQMSDSLKGMSEDEVYRTITKKNGWEGRAENLAAERDGYDMFLVSSSSSLDESVYDNFTADPGKLDILSLLKMGYWISMRFPVFRYDGLQYTFVGKHMPQFIALSSSFERRKAAQKSVQAIFYRTGIDTYTYDGNQVDISVLPSFYDSNIFMKNESYFDTKKIWLDERSVKAGYGHRRLVVDPDMEEEMTRDGDTLVISSLMMFRATIDRTKKKELITALLGELDLPSETEEYRLVDEDEIDRGEAPVFDDDADDTITDEYEYETEEDEAEKEIPDVPPVEYEKKNDRNIAEEEEKYALTDEIIRRDEEIEKEEEKFESELDDDIFDDTEEEERLDEIGEKTESDYYEEVDADEIHEEAEESTDEAEEDSSDSDGDVQLDFFSLLDEEEEKVIDDELEKEDEEEFREEEEKAEELDSGEETPAEEPSEFPSDNPDNLPDDRESSIDELPGSDESEEESSSVEENEVSDEEIISEEDVPLDDEEEEPRYPDESEETASEEKMISVEDVSLDDEELEELPHFDEADESTPEEDAAADSGNEVSGEEIISDEDDGEAEESCESSDVCVNDDDEVPDEESVSEEDVPLDDEETEEPPRTDVTEELSSDEEADEEDETASDDDISVEDEKAEESEEEITGEEDIPVDDEEALQTEEPETDESSEEEIISEEDIPLDDEETEELPPSDNPGEPSSDGEAAEENEVLSEEDEPEEDEETEEPGEEVISEEEVSVDDSDDGTSGEESASGNDEAVEETAGEPEDEASPAEETPLVSDESSEDAGKETAEETEEAGAASTKEEKQQDKPLDVNSWMKDFLGDYSDDEESTSQDEETVPAAEAPESDDEDKTLEIEDDSFVLPRDGRIEGKTDEADAAAEENTENGEAPAEAERKEETPSLQPEERAPSFASSFLDGVENAEGAENEEEEERQVLSMEELEEDESPLPLVTDEPVNEAESREEEISAEGIIYDIYKKLSPSSVFASFVRSSDSETLEELENVIQNCWNRMQGDGRDKLFNVADYSFSILLSRNNIRDDLRLAELLNNAGGVMYSREEDSWTAIILYINSDYILEGAIEKTITKDSFSPSDWKRVTYIGEQMKKR